MIRSEVVTLKAESHSEEELLARVRELEAALAREERISAALREVGAAVGGNIDLDQLLELILERITDLLEADRATLYLLDEANGELVSRMAVGDEMRSVRMKVGHGIAGTVARTGRTIRVRDAYKDRRFVRDWDDLLGYRTRSMLAAPLKNHVGKIIGVVQVVNKHGRGEFTAADEALLVTLAGQAAVSIDHGRLFLSVTQKNMQLLETKEKLEQSVRHLKLLFDLESAMNRAATPEELVREVLRMAVGVTRSEAGSVLLVDENVGVVDLFVWHRRHPDDLHRETVRSGTLPTAPCVSILSEAIRLAAPVRSRLPSSMATCFDEDGGAPTAKASAKIPAIAVPLEGEDAPMGALGLCGEMRVRYGDAETELLRLIAANFSTAVRLFRSRLRREHEERLSTIGSLLSGVIHDLKGPMAVIRGSLEMMAQVRDCTETQRYADMIKGQLELIGIMQREVLEFARGERRALVRKVYLATFFEELASQLRRDLDASKVELELTLEDRGTARFDEGKITRVIHNLARNAIEAMGAKGGKLSLRVRREAAQGAHAQAAQGGHAQAAQGGHAQGGKEKSSGPLIIEVSDTGPGIPKEIEARLFQSFVTAGKKGGTGLGLAIVKKIVDEHGGTVSVRSSREGTTFTLMLPQPESA